jgi:hypothetical protein
VHPAALFYLPDNSPRKLRCVMVFHCTLNTCICHAVCNTNLQECLSDYSGRLFHLPSTNSAHVGCPFHHHHHLRYGVHHYWSTGICYEVICQRSGLRTGLMGSSTSSTNAHVNVMLVSVSTKQGMMSRHRS